jgi:hypothetical protein
MYINKIDDLFDKVIDNFYKFLLNEKFFEKIKKDTNFVRFQVNIMELLKKFIITIDEKEIIKLIVNKTYISNILNVIKRYCAFYVYLGIGYYYSGGRDLFITNILESSKSQKDSVFQINNFYNSENNAKIITYFSDIKNILSLMEYKTLEKIKIILKNNPIKYSKTIELFNELGEDYIIENFFIKDNFHSIIKTFIFKQIYLKEEKIEINNILKEVEEKDAEYKYIEIVTSNKNKIVDFSIIQKFLSLTQNRRGLAEEIYNYLSEIKETEEIIIKEHKDYINFLFSNKIVIPISEDFLRYHKNTEKYETESKTREDTKVKYVINKINNIKNYYSPLVEKNAKLKLEIKENFYKNMEDRLVVLYNDDEELKIIQKLNYSDNQNDNDDLIDLEEIRKYAYLNFKHVSNDYIKVRTPNTIESIRYVNLKTYKKTNDIEVRVGHKNLDLNVRGIAWNPSRINLVKSKNTKPLECFKIKDMIDVRKKYESDNGYTAFSRAINKTITHKPKHELYYWLFNNSKDIPKKTKEYVDFSVNDSQKNINLLLYEIYNKYTNIVKTKLENYINKHENFDFWNLDKLFKIYSLKYYNFELNPEIKNEILFYILTNKIKEIEVTEDETDNIIPGIRKRIIKLPSVDIKQSDKNIIIIDKNKKEEQPIINKENKNIPICNHYIKWSNIKKQKGENFNQLVFDFVKKYVKQNQQGDYICKSCNELLQLKKYVYEGTYNKETDTFMTTSLAVNQKLEELPKYKTLLRTINNLNKNIEKIAYLCDLSYYLGNTPTNKLHRKTLVKDIIDLIQIHTEFIKTQPKNRIELASEKYNINKNLTNLFFFELKDEIFLISSTDTDYYKTIKYNNIMAYMIFLFLTEINAGQLINLKDDRSCNYFFYSKVGQQLFDGLFLRLNQKEKTQIIKIPLFCYALYYFSCVFANNKLWLFKDDSKTNMGIIQKSIIHTVIDLINSIIEANMIEGKNFLYEIITTRFMLKINHTFNDKEILSRIEKKSSKNIKYDETTKKISIIKNKIEYIHISVEEKFINDFKPIEYCHNTIFKNEKIRYLKDSSKFSFLTNCEDGRFHKWKLKDDLIICELCNSNYNELLNDKERIKKDESSEYINKIKINQLKNLSKKYCITSELHQINQTTLLCDLCNINPYDHKYSSDELKTLYKNLHKKENDDIKKALEKIREYKQQEIEDEKISYEIIKKFNKRFNTDIIDKYKTNQYVNYLTDFVERLIKVLGPKIKVSNKNIFLKDTFYTINHDYLGNESKNIIQISSKDDILQIKKNFSGLNKDVLFYKDKSHNVYVYYDLVTLQYLGYSEDGKTIKKNKNNASILKELSILDILLTLGLENEYSNINHYELSPELNKELINKILRNRIVNIKQFINKFESMIYSVKNNTPINSRFYNKNEKEIIQEFTKKLREFNLKDKEGHNAVFKHSTYIINNVNLKNIKINIDIDLLNESYIDCKFLNNIYNTDSKLIYYIIMNLNRLLDYNKQPAIESELSHMIVKLFKALNKNTNIDYTNIEVRKYDYILLNELPYIDDQVKFVGMYQELVNIQEIDEEKVKEQNEDLREEKDAFDVDDYEVDDDIDGTAEAFDGYEGS